MLDIKEIQYFTACVRTGSFSRAAETLFTTQSSVSKTIKAMEEEMGVSLFERQAKGIRTTPEAERILPYALSILDSLEKMRPGEEERPAELLSMSFSPSSWFADHFVKFYEKKQEERIHYQIHSADCREIVERVRERMDDLGFVYIMKNQMSPFQYYISRNYLEFYSLKETAVTVYRGGDGFEGGCAGSGDDDGKTWDFSGMKLIQRFPDEFSPDNYWNIRDGNGHTAAEVETVITTNSDYIMERILQLGKLVNISGGYLSGKPWRETAEGRETGGADDRILFGYVKRKSETLSEVAREFLTFIIESLDSE